MAPISGSLQSSLGKLEDVIALAEKKLRKMPGAATEDAWVDADEALKIHNRERLPIYWLRMCWEGDEAMLAVFTWSNMFGDWEETHRVKWLDDYPVAQRIRLAELIPDLVLVAQEAETEVEKEVDDIVGKIEQALADA